jgi:hypothetical protein
MRAFFAFLIAFYPTAAHANIAIPFVQAPALVPQFLFSRTMGFSFIMVVLIEAAILAKYEKLASSQALRISAVVNLYSTLFGWVLLASILDKELAMCALMFICPFVVYLVETRLLPRDWTGVDRFMRFVCLFALVVVVLIAINITSIQLSAIQGLIVESAGNAKSDHARADLYWFSLLVMLFGISFLLNLALEACFLKVRIPESKTMYQTLVRMNLVSYLFLFILAYLLKMKFFSRGEFNDIKSYFKP